VLTVRPFIPNFVAFRRWYTPRAERESMAQGERSVRQEREEADAATLSEFKPVREALSRSVDTHGLRYTARELGMSPTGLRGLIDGTAPYGKTVRKARGWFAGFLQREGQLDEAEALALQVLTSALPAERRDEVAKEIRDIVNRARRG
jgi:hypothetical protein